MSVQATITFLLPLTTTVLPVSAGITDDASVTNAISAIQDALPPGSLAVFGAWAVLQYTEVWNVDDGPLSGAIAWWRWNFWMPPTADNPTLSSTEPPISDANGTESQTLLHAPTISYSNLITCWMFLLLIATPIKRGIFWDDYGSYAVALFTGFIVSWRSISKFVVATPIPEGSQRPQPEDAYHRPIVTDDIHDDMSRALNALSGFPTAAVYGIMARKELHRITPANVLNFLTSQTLCSQCRQVVEGQGEATATWTLVLGLLEQHDKEMDCAVHHRRFRWMRSHSGQEEPLYCDDPNIARAIAIGGLGAWRLQKSTIVRRLWHLSLFLAIAIPLSFNYQIIWALLGFVIPVFGNIGKQNDGSPLYFPLNSVVPNGIYLADRTLIRPWPSIDNRWTSHIQYILGVIFVVFGAMTFAVASFEAWAAQLPDPSSIFNTRTLRMMSCYIMALSSFSVAIALSFALGYDLRESVWRTGLQYTLSLLISGVCLGASYAWRAHHGTMGDDKSWVTPPLPQHRLVV